MQADEHAVFHGKYLPSLSINCVVINKDLKKNATTIVLGKDEHLFNMIRVAMTSEWQRNDAVIYVSWSSNSRHCESFTGTFSSNSRLDVRKA